MVSSDGPSGTTGTNVSTTYNPHSWTNHANVLFLDQPVGVGYSYASSGGVDNSPAAAEDVYAFLQLFVGKYKKYRANDFHISGESYAGTYLPTIAHVIHNGNKRSSPSSVSLAPTLPKLNFKSVLIGNGLSDPAIQFGSVPEYACDSKYAVYDDPQGSACNSLRSKMSRCKKLAETCYA
jgi:cathepsin A (carboxypeptidase C)